MKLRRKRDLTYDEAVEFYKRVAPMLRDGVKKQWDRMRRAFIASEPYAIRAQSREHIRAVAEAERALGRDHVRRIFDDMYDDLGLERDQ